MSQMSAKTVIVIELDLTQRSFNVLKLLSIYCPSLSVVILLLKNFAIFLNSNFFSIMYWALILDKTYNFRIRIFSLRVGMISSLKNLT